MNKEVISIMPQYDNSSITQLIGKDRVRKRPAAVLGSADLAGARHCFVEMVGNALDERSAGYGDRLDIRYYKDNSISVRDYGRGVPIGWNENIKNWNWHVIYNDLYGGGKYESYQETLAALTEEEWAHFDYRVYNYLFSVGLNGLGATATQYTSEFFQVKSYHDGVCTSRSFSKGDPLVNGNPISFQVMTTSDEETLRAFGEEQVETTEPNGTFVHWKSDIDVFSNVVVGSDWIYNFCVEMAAVAGIEVHFVDENSGRDEVIPAGTLSSLLVQKAGQSLVCDENGNPVLFTASVFDHGVTVRQDQKEAAMRNSIWVCVCDLVFGFTTSHVDMSGYHNLVYMRGGAQYTGARAAFKAFIDAKAKNNRLKVLERDWEDLFCAVISTKSNEASFRNQTKDEISDGFIYDIVYNQIFRTLNLEDAKGNRYLKEVVNKVMESALDRLRSKEHAELARKAETSKREKAPEKFVSCDAYEAKRSEEVEFWITEGDSALGAVKNARSSKFQCILPIRGKGLNVAKSGREAALENKEIREIFSILGTGFDLDIRGKNTFDISKLRVGKIIFATDADEDGYQIRVLLFLMFYMLAPRLIEEGRVFIAETPRFQLVLTNGQSIFAKNDAERDKYRVEYAGRIASEHRFKGLGAVDKSVLRETTVHPDTRNLIPITCDRESTVEMGLIDALFGKDVNKQRKELITQYLGANVGDMLTDMALRIGEIDEMEMDESVEYEEVTF